MNFLWVNLNKVFVCNSVSVHKHYSLWITFLFVTSTTWSGGTEVTGRWSLTNLQQHALIRRFLLHDHAHPWLLFVLLAASLETWWPRSTLTPEFKTMEALAGWTPNWLPSSIRPLWPDVTVGPVAKFAISRLLLGVTTVIWFCIGLSYNNPTGMAAGTSGSFKKETRWDCRVFAAYCSCKHFSTLVSSSWTPQGSGMECISGLRAAP